MTGKIVFKVFILALVIFAGLVLYFDNVSAQSASVTATVRVNLCVNQNEIIEGDEQCDGSNLDSQTCQSLGYNGGTLSCNNNCSFNTSACTVTAPVVAGPGGGGYTPPSSTVILEGTAYPEATLTILKDGQIFVAGKKADSLGKFTERIFGISSGVYTFGFRAKDKEWRESVVFNVTVTVPEGVTVMVSGILIPPTIELGKLSLKKGDILDIFGESSPQSELEISITDASSTETIKRSLAEKDGVWLFSFDTSVLSEGFYQVKARAKTSDGLESPFSKIVSFAIGKALLPGEGPEEEIPEEEIPEKAGILGDFNGDNRINLTDFSILLHWWDRYSAAADINKDGFVDLVDFSIMMYYWTG
ncbi:MAG: dockerin type I repeat-containing protein [Candidatus Nealsonbacteria bacterium]|nr:dockerin type I repeat-containing protein [Candidatus Nealsonbacteria bacterium]